MYFELRKFTQEITAYNNVHLILLDWINNALRNANLQGRPAYVTSDIARIGARRAGRNTSLGYITREDKLVNIQYRQRA